MKALDDLVNLLARLPGVGKKSASRMAFFLLKGDGHFAGLLASSIAGIKDAVRFCERCGSYAEGSVCIVCSSPSRDRQQLCVVEQPQDVLTIEASREYQGLYHVLGGLISPLDGIGPEALRLDRLHARVLELGVREVVLATNPTVEGDTTALYIKKVLEDTGVGVSRLATGMPVGGDLEYADKLTLARSFRGRTAL
ncbi:MAG: recombination protein RecR [Spirochaetes bacterium GWD1_61_31]|nr:MAG: recombination protein RecR [Spirochaetes bacterium GWB1_60_80]OHD30063.1 MAG: recombination protein RecR [Spirochaetes bacterium GWC1_61_12]OHD42543.1 MAG: recombination protein RecR [Spirochaetes bacterium GWD1_61_31]OHD45071.1 MAG: recombination protein RecR [Spirochaetes bacterium GWE1_60_18]OHD59999.1 MAG: recombination protein RecR [Spirochaetes bacterium GWF1_60_12]HAP42968.1 recombination protein RecR [Spirochaetaceae bacterium]